MLKDNPEDLVKAAMHAANLLSKRHPVLRSVTITVVSPEAGPIAAGITTALLQVAREIEGRHPNTACRVSAGPEFGQVSERHAAGNTATGVAPEIERQADSTAKAPK